MPKVGMGMREWDYQVEATSNEREENVKVITTKEKGDPIWDASRLDMLCGLNVGIRLTSRGRKW